MEKVKKLQAELETLIKANKKKSLFSNDTVIKAQKIVIKDMLSKKGEAHTVAHLEELIEGYKNGSLAIEYSSYN